MTKAPDPPDPPEEGETTPERSETPGRARNGRFGAGNCANPRGRPRKDRSVSGEILNEFNRKVTINKKRVSKVSLSALQIANQGAKGDTRSAKLAIDLALKAESQRASVPKPTPLTDNDKEIVKRFLARLRATEEQSDADSNA
jgi:hypothetical protein